MRPFTTKSTLWILSALLLAVGAVRAAEEVLDPETKARIDRYEKGPSTIDVSKYPASIQANYEVFREKCSLCHKLNRPVNADYALPDEWSRYVKRMMFKPNSNISNSAGKKIYQFLVYDSAVRKAAAVAEKLAKLTPEARAAEEAKIKEALATK
ncbi:MAG: hypothetical protein ACHQ5A_02050 [Opitutales bacterium]